MKKILQKTINNQFFQGGIFFIAGSFIINFLNYLFNFLAGRGLGPKGYGEIVALFSYITLTAVPITVISTFLVQKISGSDNKAVLSKSIENLLWEKLKKWSFLFVIILFFVPLIAKGTNLSIFLTFSYIIFVYLSIIASVYNSLLQGLRLFFLFSLIGVITTFIKFLGAALVMIKIDGLFTIITLLFLSAVLGILLSIKVFRNSISIKKVVNFPKIEKRIINLINNRQFILIFISTLAFTLLSNADIIFVKKYFSGVQTGIYSSWSVFAKIILYALGPIISISFIFFSSKQNNKIENKTLQISLIFLGIIGVISFFFYYYYANFVINLLYGVKFKEVAPYLWRASVFGTFYSAIAFLNNYYLAKKSLVTLILPTFIPIYICLLFFANKNLISIMDINIFFSITVTFIYLIAYFNSTYYNISNEK